MGAKPASKKQIAAGTRGACLPAPRTGPKIRNSREKAFCSCFMFRRTRGNLREQPTTNFALRGEREGIAPATKIRLVLSACNDYRLVATRTNKEAFSPFSMKAPERTIAEAFPQYIGGQVIADSATLKWPGAAGSREQRRS